jgi:hypothetical protein
VVASDGWIPGRYMTKRLPPQHATCQSEFVAHSLNGTKKLASGTQVIIFKQSELEFKSIDSFSLSSFFLQNHLKSVMLVRITASRLFRLQRLFGKVVPLVNM